MYYKPKIFFTFIIAAFIFQNIFFIDKRVVVDEVWRAVTVYNYDKNSGFVSDAIFKNAKPDNLYQIYLYLHSLKIWHLIFPKEIQFSRLLSILAGSCLLFLSYYFFKRFFDDKLLILSSFFMLSSDNIFFVTINSVRSDIFIPIYFIIAYLIIFNRKKKINSKRFIFFAGVLFLVFIFYHPNTIVLIVSLWLSILAIYRNKESFNAALIFFLPALLLFSIIAIVSFILKINTVEILFIYAKKTTYIEKIYNFDFLLKKEIIRYIDYTQFPFRLPLAILFGVSVLYYIFLKTNEKIYKVLSLSIIATFFFFFFLFNKTSRYFIAVEPILILLSSAFLSDIFSKTQIMKNIKKTSASLIVIILSLYSLIGNFYLIIKYSNSSYAKFKTAMRIDDIRGKTIIGDLILWDIYRASNFISLNSELINLSSADYIIYKDEKLSMKDSLAHNNSNLKSGYILRKKIFYEEGIWPILKENGSSIKEVDGAFYGYYKIIKINKREKLAP